MQFTTAVICGGRCRPAAFGIVTLLGDQAKKAAFDTILAVVVVGCNVSDFIK
jgi:hypothetical protein